MKGFSRIFTTRTNPVNWKWWQATWQEVAEVGTQDENFHHESEEDAAAEAAAVATAIGLPDPDY